MNPTMVLITTTPKITDASTYSRRRMVTMPATIST
jgi:hypothetical protein